MGAPGLRSTHFDHQGTYTFHHTVYEDYQRYSTDKEVNESKLTTVLRDETTQEIKWKDVMVGDLCLVSDGGFFPADLVLISSSDKDGIAFIETASLDGEQTSKIRYAFSELNIRYKDK
jgi:phospholipid-transporting ATPase